MSEIRIREAKPNDYAGVRQCMADVFQEAAGPKTAEFGSALWTWQYVEHHSGSVVILAEDGDRICGYYHILLSPMIHRGRPATAAMVQDVGTRASHRMHGVFRGMGGFALEVLRARGVDFAYTFPNARSLPSFVRNHAFTVVAQAPVYLLPLRWGPLLAGRLGALGRLAGSAADSFRRVLATRRPLLKTGDSVRKIERFTDDVGALKNGFASPAGVSLDRTRDYLNWRFMARPGRPYDAWALYEGQQLLAYAVTRLASMFSVPCVLLMDFGFCVDGADALRRLVAKCLAAEANRGVALAVTMGFHPFLAELATLGFRRVPERLNPRTFNLLVKDIGCSRPELFEAANWTITLADWDVY